MDDTTKASGARQSGAERRTKLRRESRWLALKRSALEFRRDNLTDWAAALTYYGVFSIFPALLVLVSIVGLIGSSATQPLLDNLGSFAKKRMPAAPLLAARSRIAFATMSLAAPGA